MKTRWVPALASATFLLSSAAAAQEMSQSTGPIADPPLAGYHDGGFYLRDSKDNFRLYPRGRLYLDFNSFHGPGVSDVKAADGGAALTPRFSVRRMRLEMAGDLFKARMSFLSQVDLGGQPITNIKGKDQSSAAKAGQTPGSDTAKFASIENPAPAASIADVWANVRVFPFLQFMIGQYPTPFSMENRIGEGNYSFQERNMAVRSFALQSLKETGITAWGFLGNNAFNYEVGFFGGDGQNRPQVDTRFDLFGRVFARPFAGQKGGPLEKAQIGMSFHHGDRDPKSVGYDYTQVTSNQGVVLWDSTYKDSLGRTTHILPSGAQDAIGGELRVPFGRVDIRGEAYYVRNQTREALDGYQLSNIERLGQVKGVAWYGQVSVWAWGTPFVVDDGGIYRPRVLDLNKPDEAPKRGLEMVAMVGGINASYDGAARASCDSSGKCTPSPRDPKTPKSDMTVYNPGFAANYWATRHFRFSVNYLAYVTPGSGTKDNLAGVPGNMKSAGTPTNPQELSPGAHILHEVGARIWLAF